MKRILLWFMLSLLAVAPAYAQSTPPNTPIPTSCPTPTTTCTWTAAQWNSFFSWLGTKQDLTGSGTVNVLTYGADPTGQADSAPAFRAAAALITAGTAQIMVVPPGTYLFSTSVPQPSPYTAFQPAGVLITGVCGKPWEINGYGATIVIGTNQPTTTAFFVDRSCNWAMNGLTIQGNRTGLTTQANPALELASDVNFQINDMHMTGNFGFSGQAVAGDWLVNGLLKNWTIDSSGFCADTAYLLNVTFQNWNATGTDNTGLTTTSHAGSVCMSVIVDPPNQGFNFTGVPFTESSRVTYTGISAGNYTTGMVLKTGTYYTLTGNRWHDLPGNVADSIVGVGVELAYDTTLSVGNPVSHVTIDGDIFSNISAVVPGGAGVYIGNAQITNSDVMNGILITGCVFDNNDASGIITTGLTPSTIANMFIRNNAFSGVNQAVSFNAATEQLGTVVESAPTGMTFANGFGLNTVDTTGHLVNWIYTAAGNNTVLRNVENGGGAFIALQTNAGNDIATFNDDGFNTTTLFGPLQASKYTVAGLPTCNAGHAGLLVSVDDQNGTPTYGGALTGGGGTLWPAYCNGSAWSAH